MNNKIFRMHTDLVKVVLLGLSLLFLCVPTLHTMAFTKSECALHFSRNLAAGDRSEGVRALQKILNVSNATRVSTSGSGSRGNETNYFGRQTFEAVVRFQEMNSKDILSPLKLSKGTGYVGAATRVKLISECERTIAVSVPPIPPIVTLPPPTPLPQLPILAWGVVPGKTTAELESFEALVGKPVNLVAKFLDFDDGFVESFANAVGPHGKTLVIFWETNATYDSIARGNKDTEIQNFARDAKQYGYPIILVPFNEMNLGGSPWGYGVNGNTAEKFISAWRHIHDIFRDTHATNVKFAIDYNSNSVPDVVGNKFTDYYPGSDYVDYIGVNGFNFGTPWYSFAHIFDPAITELNSFNKPIYILSMASADGVDKAKWITDGLGLHIKTYENVIGWIWFNENKEADWRITSDPQSLLAFKKVLP